MAPHGLREWAVALCWLAAVTAACCRAYEPGKMSTTSLKVRAELNGLPLTEGQERGTCVTCVEPQATAPPYGSTNCCITRNLESERIHYPRGLLQDRRTLNEILWDAAAAGDHDVATTALKRGADAEYRSGDNNDTPLAVAAFYGHAPVVRVLLALGADPEAVDDRGLTVLLGAAQEGHAEVVTMLLEAGADPDETMADSGIAPIAAAALRGHEEVVRALLEGGADPGVMDAEGDAPLHLVSVTLAGGAEGIAQALVGAGADLEAVGADGDTPIFWAAYFGNVRVAGVLVEEGADVGARNDAGNVAADVVCGCLEDVGEDAIQCPAGGCDKGAVIKRLAQLLA
ncbi:unnamed protein product [Ostreobium quekettii]|uniref:Ankyrin repeat domain-containing protein n=1 Tax=Ostreobium quekettii TaxID=121088 RepID=A0A8S1J401_9CHLO|nr:unnamed protein product [Ostreobium quekettii]